MKKQFLAMAVVAVFFAACHNDGSSTVGEKDEAYGNSFHNHKTSGSGEGHEAPAGHSDSNEHGDTTHAPSKATEVHH